MKTKTPVNIHPIERALNIGAGSALVLYGIKRFSPFRVAIAFLGGTLLKRGATGKCSIYQAKGIDMSTKSELKLSNSIVVQKSAREIYEFFKDPSKMKHIYPNLNLYKLHQLDQSNQWGWQLDYGHGLEFSGDMDIEEREEQHELSWSTQGKHWLQETGSIRIESQGENKSVVYFDITMTPSFGYLGKLAISAFNPIFKAMLKSKMAKAKQFLETGEISTIEGQTSGREAPTASDKEQEQVQGQEQDQAQKRELDQKREQSNKVGINSDQMPQGESA